MPAAAPASPAHGEVPRLSLDGWAVKPFAREIFGAPAADFVSPRFRGIPFYEHSGAFREEWPSPS
eukprot:196609-Prymnesium_polylepis.1